MNVGTRLFTISALSSSLDAAICNAGTDIGRGHVATKADIQDLIDRAEEILSQLKQAKAEAV